MCAVVPITIPINTIALKSKMYFASKSGFDPYSSGIATKPGSENLMSAYKLFKTSDKTLFILFLKII